MFIRIQAWIILISFERERIHATRFTVIKLTINDKQVRQRNNLKKKLDEQRQCKWSCVKKNKIFKKQNKIKAKKMDMHWSGWMD